MNDINLAHFKLIWQKKKVVEVPYLIKEDPLVSICVQTYNQVAYIKECLDSLISQKTTFPIEILLAEDESEDGTRSICIDYAQKYPDKIRLFLHCRQNNIKILGEPSANFPAIYNLLNTRGKFIAICEGDDFWGDPNKLQKQVDFLIKNPAYSFAYHSYITIDHKSNIIHSNEQKNQPQKDLSTEELLKVEYHPLLLTMCFKNVFNKAPHEMTRVMNLDTFILSILGNHGTGKYMDSIEPSFYRQNGKGVWTGQAREKKLVFKMQTFQNLHEYYFRINKTVLSIYFLRQKNMVKKMLLFQLIKSKKFMRALLLISSIKT